MASAPRRLVGSALCVVVAAGLTAVVPGGAGAASPSSSTSSPPALDHLLCYGATSAGWQVPHGVRVADEVAPTRVTPAIHGLAEQCNPATTQVVINAQGATLTYKVTNASSHLACWAATARATATSVFLVNHLGDATMRTGTLTRICTPSWTALTSPVRQKKASPPHLDRFACYSLSKIAGQYDFATPRTVRAGDEFAAPRLPVVRLRVAAALCVPATVRVGTHTYKPATTKDQGLVCFPVTTTPFRRVVYDKNQFGDGALRVRGTGEQLCVPTTVAVS